MWAMKFTACVTKNRNYSSKSLDGAELKKRIADMGDFLNGQPTALIEYDVVLIRQLIEKVTVFEDKFTVEFKSGVMEDVDV